MIIDVRPETLATIQNPELAAYAGLYEEIYANFMQQVSTAGLEVAASDAPAQSDRLARLSALGASFRSGGKSLYANRLSPACEACSTGLGSATLFISLQCPRKCFYCFNPNQEDYERYTHATRDVLTELDEMAALGLKVKHLALTGGEPLLHPAEATAFFAKARQLFPKVYTRLYTCGDLATPAVLAGLQAAGLDEIRFSIRLTDLERGHREIFSRIASAVGVIPRVMVEMPVLPGSLETMQGVLLELERLGVYAINLLELCFPFRNAEAFRQRGYQLKPRPYRVLYNYWYAGGLPVAGSEAVCLDLLAFALETGLQLGVHYCSLENKHTGQLYQQNHPAAPSPLRYFSKKDYLLKSAKVFGADIPRVLAVFRKKGITEYDWNQEYGFLEFHVRAIRALRKLDLEIGISSSVIEDRSGEACVRELKVDYTRAQDLTWPATLSRVESTEKVRGKCGREKPTGEIDTEILA